VLAPLIVLMLYLLFLGRIQIDDIKGALPDTVPEKAIKAFLDCWMITGVLSTACITVSLGANDVMVHDKTSGIINDAISSPIKRPLIVASYFLSDFFVTLGICFVVYAVGIVYLAVSGSLFMSAADVFESLGILVFSVASATLITAFIAAHIKTEAVLSALGGIMSAAIGFLIGAYMPISLFPKAIQYVSALVPGSHSGALFRNVFMEKALENMTKGLPGYADGFKETFVFKLDFFGKDFGVNAMYLYMAIMIVVFALLNLFFAFKKR